MPAPATSAIRASMPDSVHAVLAARIDLLPPVEKTALQAASVIGRIFWRGPVRELLDGDAPDLAVLESRDFIRRRSGSSLAGEREFTFKHALTRDVAYASLTTPRRARLHAAFAGWLERVGDGARRVRGLSRAPLLRGRPTGRRGPRLVGRGGRAEPPAGTRGRVARASRERSPSAGTRSTTPSSCSSGRSSSRTIRSGRAASGGIVGKANALRHDGDPFLDAMMRAIELASTGRRARGALRRALLRDRARDPACGAADRGVSSWTAGSRTRSTSAGPGSASRARALIARCVWDPAGSPRHALEASTIAERLDDPELRSYAWDARGITSWVAGEHDLGRAWEERRFELVDRISDPDHLADIHYAPITGCVWLGHLGEARRLARKHDEITRSLTAHHRVHAVALYTELEELTGEWERIVEVEERAGDTILENRDTPCVRGARALLVCALARLQLGDAGRAELLEQRAEEFGIEGYGHVLETPRIRLALRRDDRVRVEELLAEPPPDRGWHRAWLLLSTHAARIDALAVLGGREAVERWPTPRRGTYLHPFVERARALVREDEDGLARAAAGFDDLRPRVARGENACRHRVARARSRIGACASR